MPPKVTPGRFRPIAGRRLGDFAVNAGLCAYFCFSCALIGGGAIGFYKLMQPVLYPNPGGLTPASTDLPPTQVDLERSFQQFAIEQSPDGTAAFASAIKPEGKAAGAAGQEAGKTKKSEHEAAVTEAKRKRVTKKRDPMMDYAAQPAFGGYRSWGSSQNGSDYRRSGNHQVPTGYQSWGSYQGWGNYQGWGGYRNGR